MRQIRAVSLRVLVSIASAVIARASLAASATPPPQFDMAVGQGVEALAVLSTQSSLSTGGYRFRVEGADGQVTKFPWSFDLAGRLPLFDSGMYWTPVVSGGVGYGDFTTKFPNGTLVGNESEFKTTALAGAIGPRIYLDSRLSVLPSLGLIYGRTENAFRAFTPAGEQFAQANSGSLVDWHAQTLTLAPSIEVQYLLKQGPWTLTLISNFAYFQTAPIERSTEALSFRSNSAAWINRMDVDVDTGLKLLGLPVHVGGTFSRTDLFWGLDRSLDTDHFYSAGMRCTLDTAGKIPWLDRVGVGVAYVWGPGFNGYSIGIEL